jgi:hypothetical protein
LWPGNYSGNTLLSNPRHEAFAQELFRGIAEGLSHGEAYTSAGYTKNPNAAKVNACRLLKASKHIIVRVQELQQQAAKAKQVSVESIVEELEEARDIARSQKQSSAMVSASLGKAKITGIDIDRTEVGKPGDFTAAQSTQELAQKFLQAANPGINVTDEMREAVLKEMQRHVAAIDAIAHADSDGAQH